MSDKIYPWSSGEEWYDAQAKDLFTNIEEFPFYHVAFMGQTGDEFVDYIVKESGIDKDSRVLDLGCGTGYFVGKISEMCYAEGISNSKECVKYSQLNFPDSKFKVGDMVNYNAKNMTHCIFMESLFFTNIEDTFKNTHKNLKNGGIMFLKEWFDVSSDKYQRANLKHLGEFYRYYPKTVDKVIEVAKKCGFELVDNKELTGKFNGEFWVKCLPSHHQEFHDIYKEDKGWPYILPFQLKFKKI